MVSLICKFSAKNTVSAKISQEKRKILSLKWSPPWQMPIMTMVVYNLHGQTGRFTVWVNGKKKVRTGKFSPGITFTICKNQFHSQKWLWRPKTHVKTDLEEMEHEFLFGTFHPEKQDYLFRCSIAPGNFLLSRMAQKVMFHLLSNRIFLKRFVKMVNNPYPTLLSNTLKMMGRWRL